MHQNITLVGNLGRDPEMRYTANGKAVTNFNLATNRTYTGADGQKVKETTWFRISAWGNQAEACNKYLRQGSKVLVEGRLDADPATGGPKIFFRADGSAGASFEIVANNVTFLDSKNDNDGGGQQQRPQAQAAPRPQAQPQRQPVSQYSGSNGSANGNW